MVLRRPYAFLIKHFRLIHLVISAILVYIVLQIRDVYKYLSSVINDTVNRYNALNYIHYDIYIFIFLALILCVVIFYLLKYKDKPRKVYIFTFIGYILIGIFMFVLFTYMNSFSINVVVQRTIRMYRDILFIVLLFQYYIIIFMFVRGLGFDIKKFNFGKDVQELNMSAEDAEEVEVNTQIDTTNVMRGLRKQGREFGYFFKEYKLYILIILAIILLVVGYKFYNYYSDKFKVYNENEMIGSLYKIRINDSYYNDDGENNYVIINFAVNKSGVRDKFDLSKMMLKVGKNVYLPDKNICYMFNTLGTCYKQQYVSSNANNYIVTYQVDNLNIQDAYLIYNDAYEKNYKVKLIMKKIEND